jgi:hypothetical protein
MLPDGLELKCVVRAGRADQLHGVRGDDEERGPGAVQPQEAARRRPVTVSREARRARSVGGPGGGVELVNRSARLIRHGGRRRGDRSS